MIGLIGLLGNILKGRILYLVYVPLFLCFLDQISQRNWNQNIKLALKIFEEKYKLLPLCWVISNIKHSLFIQYCNPEL